MEQKNGYASLAVEGQEVFLICYPPREGGKRTELKDVQFYLLKQGFTNYSVPKVKQGIESDKEVKVDLGKSRF